MITTSDFKSGHGAKSLVIPKSDRAYGILVEDFKTYDDEVLGTFWQNYDTSVGIEDEEDNYFSFTMTKDHLSVYNLAESYEGSGPLEVYLFGIENLKDLTKVEIVAILNTAR